MSTSYISAELRRQVVIRAANVCEYCLIHEADTFFGCQVDHIISEKHGGLTEANNLAYACTFCNLHKGSDIASVTLHHKLTRFFNPRADKWSEHFALSNALITSLTDVGEVTMRVFQFNTAERILERQALITVGRYPNLIH